ncbi:MAG TPA: polysaccharide pyruvyl transferase family protein [Clostridiales bacterium]|nr:polysaccharide pyruvyl transferase family protein [Clostridiales bacterium]
MKITTDWAENTDIISLTDMNDEEIEKGNTVGINLSPIVIKQNEELLNTVVKLAIYIAENTDMTLALISHVKGNFQGDEEVLEKFYRLLPSKVQAKIIKTGNELNSEQTKYLISKLRFLICARTHASIAAYSTGVPALVLGYSVKARGIAKDIFGSENYVADVREKEFEQRLFDEFFSLMENEKKVRERLKEKSEDLKQASLKAGEKLFDIL